MPTLRPDGNPQIGAREVIALEQYGLILELCERVGETVAEIQSSGMAAALPVLLYAVIARAA